MNKYILDDSEAEDEWNLDKIIEEYIKSLKGEKDKD